MISASAAWIKVYVPQCVHVNFYIKSIDPHILLPGNHVLPHQVILTLQTMHVIMRLITCLLEEMQIILNMEQLKYFTLIFCKIL